MIGVIVLAAGEGKRMKSDRAKVLHEIGGKAMIGLVLDAARALKPQKIVVVVGNRMGQVIAYLRGSRVVFAVQTEQLGTANAVLSAQSPFSGFEGEILVLCGDMPLIRAETLREMLEYHIRINASATVLTGILEEPAQYGRIVRDSEGNFEKIVEFADGDETVRSINEVNSGTYIFDSAKLWPALIKIGSDNAQGEFYLTDILTVMKNDGGIVSAIPAEDSAELLGINSPEQLRLAEEALSNRKK